MLEQLNATKSLDLWRIGGGGSPWSGARISGGRRRSLRPPTTDPADGRSPQSATSGGGTNRRHRARNRRRPARKTLLRILQRRLECQGQKQQKKKGTKRGDYKNYKYLRPLVLRQFLGSRSPKWSPKVPDEISQSFSQTKRGLTELLWTRQRPLRNTFGVRTPAACQKFGIVRHSC